MSIGFVESKGAVVQASHLGRRFPETGSVFENLNLEISPGEFVALLGPSGCGKSTLLRMVAGLEQPDEGALHVDSFGRRHFRGFVFQEAHLAPWRSALENVILPLELIGMPRKESRERAIESLQRVGLGDSLELFPSQLSGGMKMRVSLARALVTEPRLLLLDEPFAALDDSTRNTLQRDLRSLWSTLGMTILFVTHSVNEAVFLSERVVLFSQRPARTLLDRRVDLPSERGEETRFMNEYLCEVGFLGAAMLKGESTT